MDNFKRTLATDPAGVAMDLSTVLTGGEGVLARVPGAARAADAVGDAARVTNPVTLAGKAVSKVAEPVVSNVLSMTTGAGAVPIRQAARAGLEGNKAFTDNMRGNVPMTDTIDMAQSAVGQMRKDRSDAYTAGMGGIDQTKPIDLTPIHDAMVAARDEASYKGYALSEDAKDTFLKMRDKITEWQNMPASVGSPYTVEGADALKRALGEIRMSTQPGTLSRRIADKVYNAAKQTIVDQAPEYAKTMQDYAVASDKINELQKTFSLGEKAAQDTALRKLQSTQRNNVNTNYGQRNALLDELAKYEPDLPYALAGQSLNSATPRGLSKYLAVGLGGEGLMNSAQVMANPAFLASLPLFSPRVVGEAAYAGGRATAKLAPYVNPALALSKAAYAGNALTQRR